MFNKLNTEIDSHPPRKLDKVLYLEFVFDFRKYYYDVNVCSVFTYLAEVSRILLTCSLISLVCLGKFSGNVFPAFCLLQLLHPSLDSTTRMSDVSSCPMCLHARFCTFHTLSSVFQAGYFPDLSPRSLIISSAVSI